MIRILFDENYSPHLIEGLSILEKANYRSLFPANVMDIRVIANKQGATDDEVIEIAGNLGAIIFTQDTDFKKLKHKAPLYKKHNTGVVFFHSAGSKIIFWDTVVNIIKHWEHLKELIANSTPPFVFKVTKLGVERLNF
jgi:hypothetical protein